MAFKKLFQCCHKIVLIGSSFYSLESHKDPGIPKLYPFKEQVLRQLEERKQRVCYSLLNS